MPPPLKKRKLTAAAPATFLDPTQRSIQAFGKITKPIRKPQDRGKGTLHGKSLPKSQADSSVNVLDKHNGRKVQSPHECLVKQENAAVQAQPCQNTQHSTTKRSSRSSPLKKPLRSSLVDTPTKGARSRLESFAFLSSPASDCKSSTVSKGSQTPPSSPGSVKDSPSQPVQDKLVELPIELQDLINLYSAFLTALSLHYAHHGSLAPADLRILRPGIERAWRKKMVSNDDIRRVLAIAQNSGSSDPPHKAPQGRGKLSLSDYGNGKVCVEIEGDPNHPGIKRRPVNEEVLNAVFMKNLMVRWKHHNTANLISASISTFCSLLPLLPIAPCAAASRVGTLLAKGQRRLDDLKAGAIKVQLSSQQSKNSCSNSQLSSSNLAPTARNDSLLSRIRAKQLHQATLPAPPSTASLLRKAALQRLEEIAPVLEILTSSARRSLPSKSSDAAGCSSPQHLGPSSLTAGTEQEGTCSFTMPTLVQHLQMSLRNPIAKEDAARCVRLLAAEVTPNWVRIKEVGKVVGVTVWRRGRMGREEIAARVGELLRGF